jgi:hypothetical protein
MKSFLRGLGAAAILVSFASGAWAAPPLGEVSSKESRGDNPMFYYTHLLPSPYTLPAGRFILSTELAFGVTDFLQVGTNVVSDLYKIFNANVKIGLLDYDVFALALTGAWQTFNYRDFSSVAPDVRVTSWMPGVVMSYAVAPKVSASLGANLNISNHSHIDGTPISGYLHGAVVEADMAWAYYTSKKGLTNALAGGVSYDFSYKLLGIGVSHYFKSFKLGVHYYPGADTNKFLPIIGGSAVVDF